VHLYNLLIGILAFQVSMLDWVFLHVVINRNDVSSLCDGRKQYQIIVIFLAMMIHFLFSDHRKNAEDALQSLNGTTIGKQTVRLSWGRTPANKQVNRLDLLHNRIPHLVVCSYY